MAAVVRRNILTDPAVRDAYTSGVNLLKREQSTFTTADFGIAGPAEKVRTYDLFVIWHVMSMRTAVPPGGDPDVRNAAHRGPIFLPWHRVMLGLLEANLQRVLGDPSFGLPYWDWTADAALDRPSDSDFWKPTCMGGTGSPAAGGAVTDGPFGVDPANPGDPDAFRVRIDVNSMLTLINRPPRGLRRALGVDAPNLPTAADVTAAYDTDPVTGDPNLAVYDFAPWDVSSEGFRNRLEGFNPFGLHNLVHVYIGRDMGLASSPNEPAFYLHHCNIDRIWEGWMRRNGRHYLPDQSAPASLRGHRLKDPIVSPLGASATPESVLDSTAVYTYDVLP
ncbi:tyrosinase family protein [Kitasatospora sp. NPDC057965]|uniref:tyrosinase family protein n=1 Tax=Kitasatospora sp. NPDC057965 TaxID=3346291 RepID=UPI0036DC4DBE